MKSFGAIGSAVPTGLRNGSSREMRMPALRQALREESLSARKRSDPVYDGSCLQVWAERATPARAWERFVEVHEMCDEVIGSVKFEMVRLKNDDGSDNLRFFDMCPRRVSCAHATGVRAELYRGVPVGGMKNGRTLSSQRSTVLSEIVRTACSGT